MAEYVEDYCVQQFKVLVSVTKEGLELPEDQDKFSTGVRMVERKLLIKFLQVLPPKVKSLTQIRGYYIINDAMEFYKFLDLCLKKLVMKKSSAREIVKKYFRSFAVLPKSRYRRSKRRKSLMKKRRELGSMWPGM